MRVCVLVPELSTSGGVAVALGHARRLGDEAGFEVDVVVPGAVPAMRADAQLTVVALDPEGAGALDADRVLGGLGPAEMAALYAEHDVLVKLSRFEGFGLAPVEAFHAGVPCVVTPYGGHNDYLLHGQNGLLVGFDDLPGTTEWLDRLAQDRGMLEGL